MPTITYYVNETNLNMQIKLSNTEAFSFDYYITTQKYMLTAMVGGVWQNTIEL